ncbi:MAG: SDR family oxidoreductase [Bdellovibrionota bacterium]
MVFNPAMQNEKKGSLKTVIITGGGSGIGFDTARLLLSSGGYHTVLLGRNRERLEDALKNLDAKSDVASIAVCDLRDSSQIQATVDKIVSRNLGVYGLVNNAGIYPFGGANDTTEESWDECMDVNLKAPFFLTQAVARAMAKGKKGGRIVNVSSTAGILPNHFALAYSVSKAALIALTRTMAKELGRDGITMNCVCPGIVKSPLHEKYHSSKSELETFYNKRGAAFPLGRVGEPRDVAGAIRFFLSEDSSWVTGDVFVVDGGRLLM